MTPGIGLMKRRLEKEKEAIALAISGIAKKYDVKPDNIKTLETKRVIIMVWFCIAIVCP